MAGRSKASSVFSESAAGFAFALLTGLPLAMFSGTALAQKEFPDSGSIPAKLVTFESRFDPPAARPGEHVRLIVTATIADGWHVYSLEPQGEFAPPPTLFSIAAKDGLEPEGPPYEVNPIVKTDKVFDMTLAYHRRAARFYQNFIVPEVEAAGAREVHAMVRYQACSDRICTPPRKVELSAAMMVETGQARPPYAYMQRTIDYLDPDGTFRLTGDSLEEALSQGIGGFLMLAVVFGFLALLTPCVFPMIPVTVSFFTSAAKERKGDTLSLALLFGLGIVVTYVGLGLLLTFALGASGTSQFASNPWVNLVVAAFFIAFALSLMGFFGLNLPPSWVQASDRAARGIKGPAGVILMGFAFTATSFTCTVQFVGTLLLAALVGNIFWPILGMLVFSTVFALPFFLLALFPRYVVALRGTSGPWLVQVKAIAGLIELFIAFKFVSNADLAWGFGFVNREFLLGFGAVIAALCALLLLGLVPWPAFKVSRLSIPRIAWSVVFLAFAVYLVRGTRGVELNANIESYMPPALEARTVRAATGEYLDEASVKSLPWHATLEPALAQANRDRKPVFVDFTGYTCVNCRWMEKKIFAERSVFDALKERFVLAQLYTDGGNHGEENQKLQIERFRTLALPYYVIVAPDNSVLTKHAGIVPNPAEFLAWLERGEKQVPSAEPH
jgi:thiol:disulfide interchange protein DsbD